MISCSEYKKAKTKPQRSTAEERLQARKQHLKDYCSKHSFKTNPSPKEIHIAVDDELKFLYCIVPKVASSTWKTVFAATRRLRRQISRWQMWKLLAEYSEEEITLRLNTYFKFIFVREPLQRLLSAYKNKFIQLPGYSAKIRQVIIQDLRPHDFDPNGENYISFAEFIQYFSNNISRNQHWRQFEDLCHPCVIDYDFIGHLETLEDDAPLLLKKAGIDDRATFPPIHKATGESEVLKYYSQIPQSYINKLGELYRSDFEMFGYEYLGPIKSYLNQSTQGVKTKGNV